MSAWTILMGPDAPLTAKSTVVDAAGREFQVQGKPAYRPEHQPKFLAASARLVSDLQP